MEDAIYSERSITLINNVSPSCSRRLTRCLRASTSPFSGAHSTSQTPPFASKRRSCSLKPVLCRKNPEASAKDFEEGLTRQIRVLDSLLEDGVPRVREVGVHCVCRVLPLQMF